MSDTDIDINSFIQIHIKTEIDIKQEVEENDEPVVDEEEHQQKESYFQCNRCDYTTKRRYEVKNHIAATHFGLRFKCDLCSYEGKRKDKLNAHKKRIHEGVKTIKKKTNEVFPCPHCNYISKRRYELKIHIQASHEGLRHCCKYCNFSALRKDKLTHHLKIKHNFQPRKKESKSQEIQKAHEPFLNDFVKVTIENGRTFLDTESDPKFQETNISVDDDYLKDSFFSCELCPYSSKSKASLNSHIKTLHKIKHLS